MTEQEQNEVRQEALNELKEHAAESAEKIKDIAERLEDNINAPSVAETYMQALLRNIAEDKMHARGIAEELVAKYTGGFLQ